MPDRDGRAQAQGRGGAGGRPADRGEQGLTAQADRLAAAAGLAGWCQDEAGPDQALPHPGAAWCPAGCPRRPPHEDIRGGTATLRTPFRPATGAVRARGATSAPHAVLHPGLKQALRAILAALPAVPLPGAERPARARWATWLGQAPLAPLPPLRLILAWDNLAGHKSPALVRWSREHGILPLYTPLAGSWLHLAEALQRILVGRALAGQHPRTAAGLIRWLEEAVAGGNAAPTPFVWGGKRRERRQRARQRRLGGAAAALAEHQPIAA